MKKAKETLNLIALIGFLVSNFLTPLSYAVDNDEIPQPQQAEQASVASLESEAQKGEILGDSQPVYSDIGAEGTSATPQNDDGNGKDDEDNEVLEVKQIHETMHDDKPEIK